MLWKKRWEGYPFIYWVDFKKTKKICFDQFVWKITFVGLWSDVVHMVGHIIPAGDYGSVGKAIDRISGMCLCVNVRILDLACLFDVWTVGTILRGEVGKDEGGK